MKSPSLLQNLIKKARRILKHPGLDLLIAPQTDSQSHTIIITPARIGTAVQRNTIRRRVKALIHEEKLDQKEIDYVFIIKKAGVGLSYDQLKELILGAIK